MELKKLSDAEIIERTNILVKKERQITAKLLVYLSEFDERPLYAEKIRTEKNSNSTTTIEEKTYSYRR